MRKTEIDDTGMFNLTDLVTPTGISQAMAELVPLIESQAFTHQRRHNIYFLPQIDGLAEDHPALTDV